MIKTSCIPSFMVLPSLFCHSFTTTFVGQFVTLPTAQIRNRKTSIRGERALDLFHRLLRRIERLDDGHLVPRQRSQQVR